MPTPSIENAYQGAKARQSLDKLMASIKTGNMSGLENIEEFESFEDFKAYYQAETPDYKLELQ